MRGISLSFNRNHYVRARGYATGGYRNVSGSLFESVRLFYLKPTKAIVDFDGDGKSAILWQHTTSGAVAIGFVDVYPDWGRFGTAEREKLLDKGLAFCYWVSHS